MICHLCERALFMHAHGELGGIKRLLLQCHLEGCDACRARWARSVVEKDQLRRALSPVPTLDPEGERRLQIIGARIRAEQRPLGSPAVAVAHTPANPATGRGLRMAGLALASALLAIALTALAAAWGPMLISTEGRAAPSPAPLGACFSQTRCPSCGGQAANAPGPSASAPAPGGVGNAPGAATGTAPARNGARVALPHGAGASCAVHAPGAVGSTPGAKSPAKQ